MNPSRERAQRVRDLFDEALGLDEEARGAHLDRVGREDPALAREVRALLGAHERADEVLRPLEAPAGAGADAGADTGAPAPSLTGRTVSHYRILERLGGGGMGVVYRAEDTRLRRTVALKFLPPELTRHPEARERLLREAQAAGALDHPNLCTIYEIGETAEGQAFIAMACYEGETLREKVARGALPVAEALDVAAQVAEGLRVAHEAGVVHRDVKPANLLVTTEGVVKIVDFGIAKAVGVELTREGAVLGTVAYMSPEQTRGEAVDGRTDLWSLGVVLYELLTGRRPFEGGYEQAVIYSILHDPAVPPSRHRPEVSAALDRVVLRALEKEPAARYPDAASLGADLQALQTGAHAGANAEGRAGPSRPWNRTLLYGGAALLLVALLATVGLLARSGGGSGDLDSIAVLPVTNLSGDPEQDYFADGMTDLLINHLARIGGFDRVIARTSVMRYRDTERPLREIGRELGVGALVEASALREGERVRITVNLIEAETERSLWSESFERSVQDVLALQGEMAEAIAREVEVALSPQERAQLETAPTVDPEAFDLYVRGTQARSKLTVDALREAEGYFFRAIAEDPTYAPAYAGLAWVYALSGREGDEARARQHVERALELDPSLAEAHATLGQIRQFYEWDWGGAEEAYRAAIRLNPGFAEAHLELAMLLMRQRRFEEALAAARHALYLAPTSARYQSGLSEVLLYAGRYDEAVASAEEAIALDPSYHTPYSEQAIAYVQQGRYEEALRTWERCAPLGCEDYHTGTIGYTHAVAGQREEARRVLEELVALWEARYGEGHSGAAGVAEAIAAVHVGLGNRQQALDWLERAAQAEKFMVYTAINPVWETLYGEPRFQALLERIGLAE